MWTSTVTGALYNCWKGSYSLNRHKLPTRQNPAALLSPYAPHWLLIGLSSAIVFPFKLGTALNMPVNLENSAVATGLEKVSFHSNPKERQCQRMLKLPHNCTNLTR